SLTLRYDDVISDSNRYLAIEFSFNSVWQTKTKVAVFKKGETEFQVVFSDGNSMYLGNNKCYVPSEVIKSPGFSVSIYGVESNVVITSNEVDVPVEESGTTNLEPAEPTPSLWNQLLVSIDPLSRCPAGGTTGQVLQKNSGDDYDMSWVSVGDGIISEASTYFVPKTLKINGKTLTEDISLDSEDVGAYTMPVTGIPKNDLDASVKLSLSKADSALQEHQSLSGKQDLLQSGVNIKTLNNESLLGSGNVDLPATFSPIDEVIWRQPKNFGKKVNGVVGDNIKVYRDITDSTIVFLGSGMLYGSNSYNDPYIAECICGSFNTTVRKIYFQNGITGIGSNLFNRFYAGDYDPRRSKFWDVKNPSNNWAPTGVTVRNIILPPSINLIEKRAFQYCLISDAIVIECSGHLTLGDEVFQGSGFETISIPNATSMSGYNKYVFSSGNLKNFSLNCDITDELSFASSERLTDESIINIANHLVTVGSGDPSKTLTLHPTTKTLCNNTLGVVNDGVFTKDTSGTVTLTDFITNTKGWTIA
ncbi:MAG: leucine-rich repeat protein, partial [Clostridia bacterium]|nr:leucine-rich repeat protein [Clostridia bacterium]